MGRKELERIDHLDGELFAMRQAMECIVAVLGKDATRRLREHLLISKERRLSGSESFLHGHAVAHKRLDDTVRMFLAIH